MKTPHRTRFTIPFAWQTAALALLAFLSTLGAARAAVDISYVTISNGSITSSTQVATGDYTVVGGYAGMSGTLGQTFLVAGANGGVDMIYNQNNTGWQTAQFLDAGAGTFNSMTFQLDNSVYLTTTNGLIGWAVSGFGYHPANMTNDFVQALASRRGEEVLALDANGVVGSVNYSNATFTPSSFSFNNNVVSIAQNYGVYTDPFAFYNTYVLQSNGDISIMGGANPPTILAGTNYISLIGDNTYTGSVYDQGSVFGLTSTGALDQIYWDGSSWTTRNIISSGVLFAGAAFDENGVGTGLYIAVPEPSVTVLMVVALGQLGLVLHRRGQSKKSA